MVKKFLLITLIILSFPMISRAETFNQDNRIHVIVVNGNTNQVEHQFNSLSDSEFLFNTAPIRVYNQFQNYVPYPQYYYDIVYTIYFGWHGYNNTASPLQAINGCNIYIEGGSTSSGCTYTTNSANNSITVSASSVHSQTNQTSFTFQLNFKSVPSPVYVDYYPLTYELSIIANQDTSLSNDTYNQGVYNIINNQNANNQETNQNLNNINDSLNDDTPVSNNDLDDTLDDWNDSLSNENALSDFILMPFTILNNISSGLSSRCETFSLGSLLGHNIVLPCIDIEDYLGTNLWGTIDSLFCIFMIYNIAMLFIQSFEGITTLRDDFDSLYTPQHGDFGYRPRHGGD